MIECVQRPGTLPNSMWHIELPVVGQNGSYGEDEMVHLLSTNSLDNLLVRYNTKDTGSVYDLVQWDTRDVVQVNYRDGSVIFEQRNIRVPDFWSQQSVDILASKYLRNQEAGLDEMLDRVVDRIVDEGVKHGYFTEAEGAIFGDEVKFLCLDQQASFNSPVWFNIGKVGRAQQASACFILKVEDSLESILGWYRDEVKIFQGGSGSGTNLSDVRSTKEKIPGGLNASGPVSFMRGADSTAGVIRSGSIVRNAAKMVILDVDHPDIAEFIWCKAKEGRKARALTEAGFDMGINGADTISIQYQNANNSVRVSDAFMQAVERDENWGLIARTTAEVIDTVPARDIWNAIAEAAWECADPGLQYGDTINAWNTLADTVEIRSSNPCSEYLSLDNSSCNLSSINLLKYLREDNSFDYESYIHTGQMMFLAQDILIAFGEFPTTEIKENTLKYRQIGLGYTNLGATLMCLGLPYDSPEGRQFAQALTSVLTASAYLCSTQIANRRGPCDGYEPNKNSLHRVLQKHYEVAVRDTDLMVHPMAMEIAATGCDLWKQTLSAAQSFGINNMYVSNIAPTGTISFLMGADTTGFEPDLALIKFKKLVGGSSMEIVNESVPRALVNLHYNVEESTAILEYIREHNSVIGAPHLHKEHYPVFACAMGNNTIEPLGHVRMMGAVSAYLSGGISKTVNVPEDATIDDIANVYWEAWKSGVKCIAVYRDNSKTGQPLNVSANQDKSEEVESNNAPLPSQNRVRLPRKRHSTTTSFRVHDVEGYITAGEYSDGKLGELFLKVSKSGSDIGGFMDSFAVAVSIGLQYGVPLETFISKFAGTKFDPAGATTDPDIRIASSIADYVFRRLAIDYLEPEQRQSMGIYTIEERKQMVANDYATGASGSEPAAAPVAVTKSVQIAPWCGQCGNRMQPSGSCYVCPSCGTTSGCS